MYELQCKKCNGKMCVNPTIFKQKKTRCISCGVMQKLSEYWKSDSNGIFYHNIPLDVDKKEVAIPPKDKSLGILANEL